MAPGDLVSDLVRRETLVEILHRIVSLSTAISLTVSWVLERWDDVPDAELREALLEAQDSATRLALVARRLAQEEGSAP